MQWFRCYHDITTDPKLRRLSVASRWVWIAVLKIASASPERGSCYIGDGVPMTAEDLAEEAGVPVTDAGAALEGFRALKMLTKHGRVWRINKWHARQKLSDDSLERVRRYRAKAAGQGREVKRDSHADVTPQDTDIERDKNIPPKSPYAGDFETAWKEYPKSSNKAGALKAYTARRREGVPATDLLNAVLNYAAECKRDNREKRFILLASTFFGPTKRYEDYVQAPPFDDAYDDVLGRMP